jgi:predicted dehydrogenase
MREYTPEYLKWRDWWDFGGGALYDIGCHTLETPLFLIGTPPPVEVRTTTSERWPENPPRASTTEFHFALKDSEKIVKYYWYMGDGAIKYEQSFVYRYNRPGTYIVILMVEDNEGLKSWPAIAIVHAVK